MAKPVMVFDLGNVLVTWDRRLLYEQLIDDPAELDRFLDEVLTLEENAVLDRGTPLPEMTAALAARHPEHAELIRAFGERWIETMGDVLEGSVAILEELRANDFSLYALSNWGADTFTQVQERYDWLGWFDALVISGREGVVKPDPEIFALLCDRHSLTPADCVFIDDSAANIATADRLGFDAILFTSSDQLRADLVTRGILAG